MSMHPTEQELHDHVDGELDGAASARVAAHLAACGPCGAAAERLRRLLHDVRALPLESEPPAGTLEQIHRRIAAAPAGTVSHPARPLWRRRVTLAAAALSLIALSSAITAALVLRYGPARGILREDVVAQAADAQLTALGALETAYLDAVAQLERALKQQEHVLAPETARLIRTNLDIVNRALAEARAALREDPANAALVDVLRSNYERKLDVLRSASAYAATRL